ncbi:GGDEF domain-containing protein [Deinococcus aetherius]|uniref:GGDEF domain-containing protein n=1 Tax=Deinococcus aetherius TaxID=200252 RepID=A0ABM8AB26_9DEIO|nr:GGDEF domain-containing protein [Deinococcus aetherius]BDP40956.1 GGDEF domain-containing protein [Deinococcus aetherius]
MLTPRLASPLRPELRRSRQRLLWLLGGAYLLFAAVTALLNPPGAFPGAYQTPKFWIAGVFVVVLLCTALAPRHVRRVGVGAFMVLTPLLWLEAGRMTSSGTLPFELTVWSAALAGVAPLLLGSAWGGAAVLVFLAGLSLVLLEGPTLSPALLAAWVAGGLATGVTAGVSFVAARLIEANIALHEQASAQLQAARFDGLTRVLCRAATEEELEDRLRHAAEARAPLSVVMCDIDHFKAVNDQYGHPAGDDVLRGVAKRLRRTVRGSGGLVGRWGGEEFLILLPGLAKPEAQALAERLRQSVAASPVAGLPVTASLGVASYRLADDTADALLARADQALYAAKRSGRNNVK